MITKPRHVSRVVPKNRVKFSVFVDADLFTKANRVRLTTWVKLTEGMMQDLLDDQKAKK